MYGDEKVNVAHFVLFSVFLVLGGFVILCCICRFSLCSKVRLIGILFPYINDDARSKSLQMLDYFLKMF